MRPRRVGSAAEEESLLLPTTKPRRVKRAPLAYPILVGLGLLLALLMLGQRLACRALEQPVPTLYWQTKEYAPAYINDELQLRKRILIVWPTVPVPQFKGADSRPLEFVQALVELGLQTDVLPFDSTGNDLHRQNYNDTGDRAVLYRAGVSVIHPPLLKMPSALADADDAAIGLFLQQYDVLVMWTWPNLGLLKWMTRLTAVGRRWGVQVVAICDDIGVGFRAMMAANPGLAGDKAVAEVVRAGLAKRDPAVTQPAAAAAATSWASWLPSLSCLCRKAAVVVATSVAEMIEYESAIYARANLIVGITNASLAVLRTLAPETRSATLRYVAPLPPVVAAPTPADRRTGFLFVGYDNPANNMGVAWFGERVLPVLDDRLGTFHIVGMVRASNALCAHRRVRCHGPLDDRALSALLATVVATINPIMEHSGVATKSCRSLLERVPVVTTTLDGTFSDGPPPAAVTLCTPRDARCFAAGLARTADLTPAERRRLTDDGARHVEAHFGVGQFREDVRRLLHYLSTQRLRVAVEGAAVRNGESMAAQNYHILRTLASMRDEVEVVYVGDPPQPAIVGVSALASRGVGFQVDVWMQQSWPPQFGGKPAYFCGPACRKIIWLPWEFGSLPAAWVRALLREGYSEVWTPSTAGARGIVESGVPRERVRVVPCVVDCKALPRLRLGSARPAGPVHFFFTGGLIPRKGVDLLLDAWNSSARLCLNPAGAQLTLHTSYVNGYDDRALHRMQAITRRCAPTVVHRSGWMSVEEHSGMLAAADVYVAPYRSEGFGIPAVEAMVAGIPVITTVSRDPVGHPAAADALAPHVTGIPADEVRCTTFPCSADGRSICVNPPCSQDQATGQWRCQCMPVAGADVSWFEPEMPALVRSLERFVALGPRKAVQVEELRRAQAFAQGFCANRFAERLRHALRDPVSPYHDGAAGRRRSLLPQPPAAEGPGLARPATWPPLPRVVFSFSTSPVRIGRTAALVRSLCDQRPPPARVVVALPQRHARMPSVRWDIPLFLTDQAARACGVDVLFDDGPADPGPALKLSKAVEAEEALSAGPTVFITIDDDKIYRPGLVADLLEAHGQHPRAAIGFAGSSTSRSHFCIVQGCSGRGEIELPNLEGFAAVLYPRETLGTAADLKRFLREVPQPCSTADDLIFSAMLHQRGVKVLRLFGRTDPIIGGFEDDTGLHSRMTKSVHIEWHPEEMKKYQMCLSSRHSIFESLHRLAEAFRNASVPVVRHGELRCNKWCYRFQCPGRDVSCERRAAVWDKATFGWIQPPKSSILPASM